jgi:deazaflavin-dependent oxidoreductase (nitroreductase family)
MAADRKRRLVVWFEKHLQNPPVRLALLAGLPLPPLALLETTGRTSGKPRRTPLIDGLVGDQFWVVAEHGRHAHYVRNLERDPHVRVKRRRRWHSGLARVLDHDPLAEPAGWPTPSGRCTKRTRPWRVCSAPTCSPSASTLTMSQANRTGDQQTLQEDSAGGSVCPLTVPDARRLLVAPVWTTPSPAC